MLQDRLQTMPAVYSWNNPHLEFTRQIQQQHAMQAQAYHQQQQMQEVQLALQQQAYQQEIRNQLQQVTLAACRPTEPQNKASLSMLFKSICNEHFQGQASSYSLTELMQASTRDGALLRT